MKLVELCVLLVAASAAGENFGPNSCVALVRSTAGSCVISTDCQGADITQTEFAFDCVNTEVVRHSFGVGGFEANEEFDTEVKCARCDLPTGVAHVKTGKLAAAPVKKVEAVWKPAPVAVTPSAPVQVVAVLKAAPVAQKPKAKKEIVEVTPAPMAFAVPTPTPKEQIPGVVAMRVATKTEVKVKVEAKSAFWPFSKEGRRRKASQDVQYGPDGCVSTYKNEEGHCIMVTDCGKSNVKGYEFGLVCVDKTGSPVKHLFGKDSFDSEETFDTLIKCDKCLGLEDIPDSIALAGEVATMAKDVASITAVMKNISINVQMLNQAVFPAAAAPAAAAPGGAAGSPAPAMKAPKAKKALVHQAVTHHKHHGNLRRSHKRHHHHHRRHHRDEDEDDEDDDDERYGNQEVAPIVAAAESLPANAFVAARSVPVMDVAVAAQQMAAASSDDDEEEEDDGNGEDY